MVKRTDSVEAMVLFRQGHLAFDLGDFQKSASCFQRAIQIADGLPEEIRFDRRCFVAACNAGLSGALGSLGQSEASLACAEAALSFYDHFGSMYPAEIGNWFLARFNKGASLANLGRLNEALEALEQAKTMLSGSPEAAEGRSRAEWRSMCEQSIQTIKTAQRTRRPSKKKWWHFWR